MSATQAEETYRTELEVAADVIAALVVDGVVNTGRIRAAADAVGVMTGELEAALARRRQRGYLSPRRRPTREGVEAAAAAEVAAAEARADKAAAEVARARAAADEANRRCEQLASDLAAAHAQLAEQTLPPPSPAPPAPSGKRHGNAGRVPHNKKPEGKTRVCVRCNADKPIGEFLKRTDSKSRRTECDDCRKEYRSERYLTVEMGEKLAPILRFIVEHGDPMLGQVCPRCQRTFTEGDEVEAADVLIHHHNCHEEPDV